MFGDTNDIVVSIKLNDLKDLKVLADCYKMVSEECKKLQKEVDRLEGEIANLKKENRHDV